MPVGFVSRTTYNLLTVDGLRSVCYGENALSAVSGASEEKWRHLSIIDLPPNLVRVVRWHFSSMSYWSEIYSRLQACSFGCKFSMRGQKFTPKYSLLQCKHQNIKRQFFDRWGFVWLVDHENRPIALTKQGKIEHCLPVQLLILRSVVLELAPDNKAW